MGFLLVGGSIEVWHETGAFYQKNRFSSTNYKGTSCLLNLMICACPLLQLKLYPDHWICPIVGCCMLLLVLCGASYICYPFGSYYLVQLQISVLRGRGLQLGSILASNSEACGEMGRFGCHLPKTLEGSTMDQKRI